MIDMDAPWVPDGMTDLKVGDVVRTRLNGECPTWHSDPYEMSLLSGREGVVTFVCEKDDPPVAELDGYELFRGHRYYVRISEYMLAIKGTFVAASGDDLTAVWCFTRTELERV